MTLRMTVTAAAELLKVKTHTLRGYASRGTFPAPEACPTCGYSPTWSREEVEKWGENRGRGPNVGGKW